MQSYNPAIPGCTLSLLLNGCLARKQEKRLAKHLFWRLSAVAFYIVTFNNDARPPPKRIVRDYDVLRIRARLGGLPHLEMFTWQNVTLAGRVTRSGRPGYPPWRVTPPIMYPGFQRIFFSYRY